MSCRQSRKLFGASWDDELTQAEREWLEAHFASCASCRTEYEEWTRTLEMMESLPRVEVAPGLAERSLAKARRQPAAADRFPAHVVRWIPITATAALLATAGAMVAQWSGIVSLGSNTRVETPVVREPSLVTEATPSDTPRPSVSRSASESTLSRADGTLAALPDSLLDQGEDVEFILDAMTLHKGRAHPASRLSPTPVRGEQAVITF
ncbi:MAG: hypothetical protein E6K78_00865 [Candidatus Eisenbacteria bacterium]|uniref:Putative zinc-finger domain-containing protein n=1 Tax=Eiseniibacteriota bacterium TaxID=2212470 RepID=A0A538TY10_UNCEI|nr:MAG: hypothetical protein E6K78_00865 [Candidatus Eisenbacteria bacterium]